MVLDVAFYILAVVAVVAALIVVTVKDIFRAALSLILAFLMVAGLYVTLSADFLAAVQVLIYVGGISVLIVLAIMLTRDLRQGNAENRIGVPALLAAVLVFGVAAFAVLNTPWRVSTAAPLAPTTAALAERLFGAGGYILAVEIAVVLMLAAVLGAIVLVREK